LRRKFALALSVVFATLFAGGQQTTTITPTPALNAQTASSQVYAAGPNVTAPELVPMEFPIEAVPDCKKKDGWVYLAAIVDSVGTPRFANGMNSQDLDLETLAKQIASKDRFKPGVRDGIPVAVGVFINIWMQTCEGSIKGEDGKNALRLVLRFKPEQQISAPANVAPILLALSGGVPPADSTVKRQVGGNVSAPVPLAQPVAEYSDYARKNRISGICLVGLIVDSNGMPQNVHVVRSLEPSLDQKAVEAVKKYRFKPAMKDGRVPVPVMVNVEVNFRR